LPYPWVASNGQIITPAGTQVYLGITTRAKAVALNPNTSTHTAAVLQMGAPQSVPFSTPCSALSCRPTVRPSPRAAAPPASLTRLMARTCCLAKTAASEQRRATLPWPASIRRRACSPTTPKSAFRWTVEHECTVLPHRNRLKFIAIGADGIRLRAVRSVALQSVPCDSSRGRRLNDQCGIPVLYLQRYVAGALRVSTAHCFASKFPRNRVAALPPRNRTPQTQSAACFIGSQVSTRSATTR